MARRVQVILEDDLDGSAADRTVEFSFDGARYEIDLNAANIERMASALAPFVAKARSVGGRRAGTKRSARAGSGTDTKAVREWAKQQGIKISERGRIPVEVLEAFKSAH